MFSGLGSISDLNEQFSQFTSNLTNLDTLQGGNEDEEKKDALQQQGTGESSNQNEDAQKESLVKTISENGNQEQITKLEAQLRDRDNEITRLQYEVEQTKTILNNTENQEQITKLEAQLRDKDNDITRLQSEVEQTKTILNNTENQEQITKLEAQLRDKENDITRLQSEVERTKKVLTEQECTIARVTLSLNNSEGVVRDLTASSANEMKASEVKISSLTRTVKDLEAQVSDKDAQIRGFQDPASAGVGMSSQGEAATNAAIAAALELEQRLREEIKTTKDALDTTWTNSQQLEERLQRKEESIEDLKTTLLAKENDFKNEIDRLKKEVVVLSSNMENLNSEKVALLADLTEKGVQYKDLEEKFTYSSRAATAHSESAANSANEVQGLKEELTLKDRKIAELEDTIATLTEKMKDVMRRYAEVKTKSSEQMKDLEQRLSDTTQLAQAKDSEILAFRLKLERMDQSSTDYRVKVSELADRHGEAQRELNRLRELLGDKQTLLEEHLNSLQSTTTALQESRDENSKLALELEQLTSHCSTLTADRDTIQQAAADASAQREREASETIAQLQAELAATASRLQLESDSAGNLDNYKKRAQLALKKANSASAGLLSENQQLKTAMEDCQIRIAEAQETARVCNEAEEEARLRLQAAEAEKETTLKERDILQEMLTTKEKEYEMQVHQLQLKVTKLESTRNNSCTSTNRVNTVDSSSNSWIGDVDDIKNQQQLISVDTNIPSIAPVATTAAVDKISEESSIVASAGFSAGSYDQLRSDAALQDTPPRAQSWARAAATSSSSSSEPSARHGQRKSQPDQLALNISVHHDIGTSTGGVHGADAVAAGEAVVANHSTTETTLSSVPTESLLFINQLQAQCDALKKDLSQRGIDLEAAQQDLAYERNEKRALKNKLEELISFLDRTKQLNQSPDSAMNMEYLKNCVYKFMCSTEISDRKRLVPVIATILKFTQQEIRQVDASMHIVEEREHEFENTISSIGSFATSSLSGLWGSASSVIVGNTDPTSDNAVATTTTTNSQPPAAVGGSDN